MAARAKQEGAEVASTAVARGRDVSRSAAADAKELVGTVKEQAALVGDEVATQGRTLVEETRTQIESQAQAQARRLADSLRRLGGEADALAKGRPEAAPTLSGYARRVAEGLRSGADQVAAVADDVEDQGIGVVVEDLSAFARRRPAAFMLGALVAGFGVGRVVQSGRADGTGR